MASETRPTTDSAFSQIIHTAFESAIEQTVRQIIANKVGAGLDGDIKDAVKDEAFRILREDEEIRRSIRDRLTFWISRQ